MKCIESNSVKSDAAIEVVQKNPNFLCVVTVTTGTCFRTRGYENSKIVFYSIHSNRQVLYCNGDKVMLHFLTDLLVSMIHCATRSVILFRTVRIDDRDHISLEVLDVHKCPIPSLLMVSLPCM